MISSPSRQDLRQDHLFDGFFVELFLTIATIMLPGKSSSDSVKWYNKHWHGKNVSAQTQNWKLLRADCHALPTWLMHFNAFGIMTVLLDP